MSKCIEPYEHINENLVSNVVVDAEISDLLETHIIKLSQSNATSNAQFKGVGNATVILQSTKNDLIIFEESNPGIYSYNGQLDKSLGYNLDIKLMNDQRITSKTQRFPESFMADSISNETNYVRIQQADGTISYDYLVSFFINANKNQIAQDYYLRLDVETVFIVLENICSPFIPPKTCYIYNHRSNFKINLLNIPKTSDYVSIVQNVFEKELDYEMGGAFSVKVDVLSYTKENYKFWQEYKSLFDQSGSVTDVVPSTITGNLESSEGSVQGLFSLVSKTAVSKILLRGDAGGRSVEPYCGTPGFFQPYPMPSECCDCLLFPNSTIQKPAYW